MYTKKLIISFISLFFLFGCGEKFDITQFESESNKGNIKGDTLYIP
jgi:hypothetical protein